MLYYIHHLLFVLNMIPIFSLLYFHQLMEYHILIESYLNEILNNLKGLKILFEYERDFYFYQIIFLYNIHIPLHCYKNNFQ